MTPRPPNPESAPAAAPGLATGDLLLTLLLGSLGFALLAWAAQRGTAPAWLGPHALQLWLPLWLLAGTLAGGPLLAARQAWLKKGLRLTRSQFVEYGGGFYGAMALVCFAWLEWARLREAWADWVQDPSWPALWPQLMDFGIDSFLNGIYAFAWPGFIQRALDGERIWPAVAVGFLVFEGGRRLVAHLPRRVRR